MPENSHDDIPIHFEKSLVILIISGIMIAIAIISYYKSGPIQHTEETPIKASQIKQPTSTMPQTNLKPETNPAIEENLTPKTTTPIQTPPKPEPIPEQLPEPVPQTPTKDSSEENFIF